MTVPALNFVCHTEPLPDYADGKRYFSINVAVTFDAAASVTEADVKKYLDPRKWSVTGGFFTRIDNANKVRKTIAGTLVAGKFAEPAAEDAAAAMLDHLWNEGGADVFKLAKADVTTADANLPRWHAALLQFGTGAARVSHALEITAVFSVPAGELTDIVQIIGAPEIEWPAESLKATPKMVPDGHVPTADPLVKATDGYQWFYSTVTAVALTNASDIARSGKQGFVDLATGWVVPDAGFKVRAADVNVALESRGADLFDATTHLLDALDPKIAPPAVALDALPWLIADDVSVEGLFAAIVDTLKGGDLSDAELADIGAAIGQGLDPASAHKTWLDIVTRALNVSFASDGFAAAALRDALRDVTRFRTLVVELWILAAAAHVPTAVAAKFAKRRAKMLEELARRTVDSHHRQIARVERQAIIARASASAAASAEVERTNVVNAIVERVMKRWTVLATNARIAPALAAFGATLEARAKSAAEGAIRGNPKQAQLDALNEDGLAIQVSPVAADAKDPADLMRRISGFGVLLRPAIANKKWSCLNMALLSKSSTAAIVPSRLQYRNGVRQSYLVYENEPLVAASPLGEANLFNLESKPGEHEAPNAILAYGNAYQVRTDWVLPPLVYGREYEVAAFAIGNGGALPKELADKSSGDVVPWELKKLADEALSQAWKVDYRRRRPVSTCRVGTAKSAPAEQTFESLGLPAIPAQVHPIARSLEPPLPPEDDGSVALAAPSASLLLLHHASATQKSFSFDLRPPAVDMPVWDRWVGRKAADAKRNAQVWADYQKKANAEDPNKPHRVAVDLSVDDPAVGVVYVHLERRWSKSGGDAELWKKIDIPFVAASGEGLGLVRTRPVRVNVVSDDASHAVDVDAAKRVVTVKIPQGEVWRVSIHAAVADADAKRFEDTTAWFDTSASANPPAGVKLAQPLELDVEVIPAQQPISADELHAALQLTSKDGRLLVKVDRAKLGATAPWIHDVEVLLQQWRWDGRPLTIAEGTELRNGFFARLAAGAPAGAFASTLPAAEGMLLDATLFADRDSADRLEIPAFIEAMDKTKSEWTLHERDLVLLRGALYFRAAVCAHSRYAPITDIAVDSRLATIRDGSGTVVTTDAWQRTVVPSRWKDEVPPPAVKLVLPLTRPASEARNAGVLVVLDEPWFDIGGLGERFESEVMTAAVPDTADTLPEIGPDPILSLAPLQLKAGVPIATATGPIGFTFDEPGVSAPLFARSSFIVEPASAMLDESRDLAWTMVKLRFRRVLERESFADEASRMADRASEPTAPFWAQLLPSAATFDCAADTTAAPVRIRELQALREGDSLTFRHEGSAVTPLALVPDALSRSTFTLYVMLTRMWMDAGGQESESYVGVLDLAAGGVQLPRALAAGKYFVRLLEVQSHSAQGPVKADRLWETLFPDKATPSETVAENEYDATLNASARIVRMSDRMEVTSA